MPTGTVAAVKTGAGVLSAVKSMLAIKDSYDKQHIDLLRTKVQMLVELVESYEKENENLIIQNTELNKKLSTVSISEEFVESNSVLFKRNIDGTYSNIPHCPVCKSHMTSGHLSVPYRCIDCKYVSNLKSRNLKSAIPII